MPRDRLPLTVGIARKIDLVRILRIFFERTNELAFTAYIDVFRRKFIVDIDAELALRKIAQMSHGSSDNVVLSEMPLDGLCLGRRLYNHKRFGQYFFFRCLCVFGAFCFRCFRFGCRFQRSQSVSSFQRADRRAFHSL